MLTLLAVRWLSPHWQPKKECMQGVLNIMQNVERIEVRVLHHLILTKTWNKFQKFQLYCSTRSLHELEKVNINKRTWMCIPKYKIYPFQLHTHAQTQNSIDECIGWTRAKPIFIIYTLLWAGFWQVYLGSEHRHYWRFMVVIVAVAPLSYVRSEMVRRHLPWPPQAVLIASLGLIWNAPLWRASSSCIHPYTHTPVLWFTVSLHRPVCSWNSSIWYLWYSACILHMK